MVRQIPYHLYVESKIWHKGTYLWNRNRILDIENRLVVAKGEGAGGGMEREVGVSRCKLLYIEWINKVLLSSTENYIQYPVINHNGKEYIYKKKECWASLVAQWLRVRLPMQGTRVRALVQEDPPCRGATKPVRHNYWACTLEPASLNYWSPCA